MAKRNSRGGSYLKQQRAELAKEDVVCTCHVKRESELTRVSKNVVRRKRG